jgi:hypothetical protein
MNAEEFVANWKNEKEDLLRSFMGEKGKSLVASKIDSMALNIEQKNQLQAVLNAVLTDTMYTLLLGLDGSASLGNNQHTFKIYDESGNLVSDCGEIEAEAWRQFHEDT